MESKNYTINLSARQKRLTDIENRLVVEKDSLKKKNQWNELIFLKDQQN